MSDTSLQRVSKTLLSEAARAVGRELDSRRALNAGLQQLIAFTGILLAAAFALGSRAGEVVISCESRVVLVVSFIGAIVGLLAVMFIALFGLRPQRRALPTPEVFRYYASQHIRNSEVRADLFGVEVDALEDLARGNQRRAECQQLALRVLVIPLVLAAVGAATLFFAS